MKIRALAIEGFGSFHDFSIDELSDGLTVFHGPNEAGKSTMLAFLRGVLFGFPDRRRRAEQYEPQRGGKHGGRVVIEGPDGLYTVVRRAGRRLAASVLLPNGDHAGDEELARLLGGADSHLFRSVFAFSLTELQTFESLTAEGVRERIFSAGVAGAGRSAREAIAELESRATELFRPRGKSRARTLLDRRRELDLAIREARQRTDQYAEIVEHEHGLVERLDALKTESETARAASHRLTLLVDLWPTWNDLREVESRLTKLDRALEPLVEDDDGEDRDVVLDADPATDGDPALAPDADRDLGGELEVLDRSLAVFEKHLAERDELASEVERTEQALDQQLLDLGPDWSAERVRAFDQSIPRREEVRTWQRRLEQSASALATQAGELERHHATIEALEQEQKRVRAKLDGPEPPRIVDLEQAEQTLRRVRATLATLSDLENTLQSDRTSHETRLRMIQQLESDRPWLPAAWLLVVIAIAAAGCLGVAAFAGWDRGTLSWPPLLGGFLLAIAAYALQQIRRHGTVREATRVETLAELEGERHQGLDDIAGCEAEITALNIALATEAHRSDLSSEPSQLEIEEQKERLERARMARQAWEDATTDANAIASRVEQMRKREREIDAGLESARQVDNTIAADWLTWKEDAGLPVDLSPQGVSDFFDALRSVRSTIEELAHANDRLLQAETAIDEWTERARRTLGACGRAPTSVTAPRALIEQVTRTRHDWQGREDLRRRLRELESSLADRLGSDETADILRQELATGRIESWKQEESATRQELERLTIERDDCVRSHQDLRSERTELEDSADLPALELEHAAVETELIAALEEWRELELARALIEETLAVFERTRQPAVLAAASELFAQVTGGRYHRLVLDATSGDIHALDHRGDRKPTHTLSRGTAEQLYLCLRIGLATEFAERSAELPMIMDDVLVNFDPERGRAMADVLARVAERQQIMLFTCHPTTRDCLTAADPEARVIELKPVERGLQLPVA